MQEVIQISTNRQNGLYDITHEVENIVSKSGFSKGIVVICF